ncbi:MAG TPA: polysaccharide biosynthesis tyrosine autokinase [Bryobacteraceae bacterium]|jgi:capsular exopolysaccharide synthesis family protein|nr:polysaccharide biosynthesis tyrosine autokinase [Bryobacteraceae bacterium]
MEEFQHLPNGAGRELARLTPHADLAVPAPMGADTVRGGVKREYAGVIEYWQMVRRHKVAVVVVSMLGAIAGFLYTLPQPRIYQAHTTIEVQGLNEDFLGLHNVSPTVSPTSNYYPDFDIQTQVKIMQSESLANSVVADLEKGKPPENLRPPDRLTVWKKALKIDPPSQDELWRLAIGTAAGSVRVRASGTNRIVEITCDSTQPQIAASFANTLTREFIEQNLEARWKSTEYTGEWLTRQLQDIKIKLEKADEELNSYAKSAGLTFTDEKTSVEEDKLRSLQKDLLQAQSDRVSKQSKYEMAASSPPEALPDVLDDSALRDDETNLTDLGRKYAELRIALTPQNPEVRRVQAQMTLMEATIKQERANILTRIKNEYEAAQNREKLMTASYLAEVKLVADQSEKTTHYGILKREVDSTRSLYETMLQRMKEASVASALRASNIRVVDPAVPPEIPYKPNVPRYIVMGLLLGICVGVSLVVLRERADRTLHDPGDIAYYLHLPELGVVPTANIELTSRGFKTSRSPQARGVATLDLNGQPGVEEVLDDRVELITHVRKKSLISESFRTTLTSILFSGHNGNRPRVLVMTSASPKEGKTTVVCNLAIALAEINHRVLVIDADLRRPRMHNVFGVKNDNNGLSELLLKQEPLDEAALRAAVRATHIPNLFVMPAGRSRFNAASLLHSERLPELLRGLRQQFDTIMIDTPPMVNIPDARVLARLADGVILILRSAHTTRDAALLAKQRFIDDGIPVMGTILNNWNPNTPGYGYYRNYYEGYFHYLGDGNGNGNGNGSRNGKHGGPKANGKGHAVPVEEVEVEAD